jgi:hypothetical protein
VTLAAATALVASIAFSTGATAATGYQTSSEPYIDLLDGVGGEVVALINSGEEAYGTLFQGIPDGIGIAPGPNGRGYIDLYVTHEQSHVPFGGFADFEDSSVSRVRVDVASKSIIDLDVALPASAGFIRFCSAFMAGPAEGFAKHTFLVNEESNDQLPVPAGAPYGSDPSITPLRQAGYSAFLDTATGKYGTLAGAGRHNHENLVIVPGWKKGIVDLSGDDTFTTPSTPERPNLSQLYLSMASNANHFIKDDQALYAFRVTATNGGPVDPTDAFNDANDYFEIGVGADWKGEFIPVPDDVARGTTGELPQNALEDWSNANNVFQFIRVEDIAYDPDSPRTVYFADTGNSRLLESDQTGRLWRGPNNGNPAYMSSPGRIFKLEFNANDPMKVDHFTVLTEASSIGMRSPDNIAVGHSSLMVQEDASNALIWQYSLSGGQWTKVAMANQPPAETSGIVDASAWFGAGWWAVDVQSHINLVTDPNVLVWDGPPGPPVGETYQKRLEDGQLLLIRIDGS